MSMPVIFYTWKNNEKIYNYYKWKIIPKVSTQKKRKSQLNINLDTELLKSLKIKSIQQDKTFSEYISEILIKEITDN